MTASGTARPGAAAPRLTPLASPPEQEVSLVRLVNTLLRQRALILGCALVAFLATETLRLLAPRSYTVRSSLLPQSRRVPSSLSGIAAQFGLSVPGTEATQSPAFYVELVKSRVILVDATLAIYAIADGRDSLRQNLLDYWHLSARTEALRREVGIRKLNGLVDASVSQKTGLVILAVTASRPELAEQINAQLLLLLNRFNLETRQSQASAERRFTEARLEEVRRDLRAAEDRQQVFLQRNRDYRNSPELVFQQDRLAREVAMQQQLYTTLAQAYEQAKLEEVRDTPVITVVERPEVPARPDRRGLIRYGLAALVVGGLLGALLAFGGESVRRSRAEEADDYREFDRLRREAFADLLHPTRLLRRRAAKAPPE